MVVEMRTDSHQPMHNAASEAELHPGQTEGSRPSRVATGPELGAAGQTGIAAKVKRVTVYSRTPAHLFNLKSVTYGHLTILFSSEQEEPR